MTRDRIDCVKLKIERADKHIRDLELAIKNFLDRKPYKVLSKQHPQLPYATTFYVERADPVAPDIRVIAGDAVHNLRSALDHLAWQCVEASGNKPGSGTAFPIFDPRSFKTKAEEDRFFERKVQGMNRAIQDAIRAQKPYKGGNDPLWTIHDLDIVDKHRLLLAVGFASPHIRVKNMFNLPLSGWPLKEGEDIVTIPREVKPEEQLEFAFDVILGEFGFFQSKSLVEALSTMLNVVENVLSDFSPFLV